MMAIPTYLDVLKKATPWRAENTPAALEKARACLVAGMEEFDDALPLGDELVLVLKGLGQIDEGIKLLRDLERRFKRIGEETLCRWGALYKLRANRSLTQGRTSDSWQDFVDSERFYARAYEQHTTFYARINELTVRFVRASLAKELGRAREAAELLADVKKKAEAMLVDLPVWVHHQVDDAIWSPATYGEVFILLGRWKEAEESYREAVKRAEKKKFYHDCMRDQIQQVLKPAFDRMTLPFLGPLANPDTFFAL